MTAPAPEATPQGDVADPAVAAANNSAPEVPAQEPDKETDWKAAARKWEKQAKENKDAATELQKIRESQMSEAEKAAATQKANEAETERLRNENVRYKAAALHGLSEESFDLLGTGTEEEILARAVRVGELEDAVNELESVKAELAALRAAIGQTQLPGPVPGLNPGAPGAPDTSYPAGWFPSLTKPTT